MFKKLDKYILHSLHSINILFKNNESLKIYRLLKLEAIFIKDNLLQ